MDQCLGIKLKNGYLVDGVKLVYERATHTQHGGNQIMGIMQSSTWVGSPGLDFETTQNV